MQVRHGAELRGLVGRKRVGSVLAVNRSPWRRRWHITGSHLRQAAHRLTWRTWKRSAEIATNRNTTAHPMKNNELGANTSRTCEKRSNDLGEQRDDESTD